MTAVLLLPSLPLMSSCRTGFYYDNAGKYTPGGTTLAADTVEAIDVEWFNGDVEISFNADSNAPISVSETASRATDDTTSLHYWLDGTTLKIKFAASGKLNLGSVEKVLRVSVPRDKTLRHLSVNGGSANVVLKDPRSEKLTVSAISGNISVSGMRVSDSATISSTSGNIEGNAAIACDSLKIKSTAGSIDFSTEARIRNLSVETTSGNVHLSNLNPAKKARIDSVSGNVLLEFLDNSGFSLEYDTVNGKFSTDLKMYTNGKAYVYGTPNSEFLVKTAAGNLTIKSVSTN